MNKKYYKTKEEWKALRDNLISEGRIGGSMVGTACGCDPWKSPYTLWAEMTGRLQPEDLSGREAIRVGTDLEDYVAKRFCDLTGKSVHRENCIITTDACPHLFASIDRKVSNEESGLECKTANAYRDGAFAEGKFPDGYYKQVKTYLAVTGLDRWYLAVLVMGISYRVFLITRKAEDMNNLPDWISGARYVSEMELADCEADAADFIEYHVKCGIPPELVGAEDERDTINALHSNQSSGSVDLGMEVDALILRRQNLKERGDSDSVEIKAIENEIIAKLNGAEMGATALSKVTYKWYDIRRLDKAAVEKAFGGKIPDECYKVTNSPTLRISSIKKNY